MQIKKTAGRGRRRGQTLIGVMVALAIVIAVAGIYLSSKGKNPDGSTSKHTALRRSVDLAQEVALKSNLSQIQQLIGMYRQDNEGKPPVSFDDLKRYAKFPAEMWINPVDKKPLGYEPATGAMIVKPYEGMSPSIASLTAAPGSQPELVAGGSPPAPEMPVVPNSGQAPPGQRDYSDEFVADPQ